MRQPRLAEPGKCHDCKRETNMACRDNGYPLCEQCQGKRDRAYDNFVDPLHWYHQHDPDRMCEP